jgi:predicted Zn finger-like uncharacterized protein
MIVTCPECLTKFRLEEERIPQGGGKARCSKCRHIFQVQKPAPPDESSFSRGEDAAAGDLDEFEEHSRGGVSRWKWVISALLILVIAAGAAWYFLSEPGGKGAFSRAGQFLADKAAAVKKASLSLPFIRRTVGLGDQAQGSISLDKVKGYYVENSNLSRAFVIEGEATNHWDESRSFIKVKGTLLDSRGNKVREQEAYCGNILSEKDLREMSRGAIEKSLASQFGISFSNVNVLQGKSVPFMILFLDLPPEGNAPSRGPGGKPGDPPGSLSDFTVEVVSSQKGSK